MMLDTCAMLFLVTGDKRLSDATRQRLSRASARWFCAISSYEIALRYHRAKLKLPTPPGRWIAELARRYALSETPVDSALCCAAAALPQIHRDPFDRFIIASAQRLGCAVVTVDPIFAQYGLEVLA